MNYRDDGFKANISCILNTTSVLFMSPKIVTFYDYDYVNTKRKCQDATIIEIFTLIFFKSFVVHSVCWWWLM